jgi:NADP-dependent 3-hydroxy acid dehydrogenase YdfG
MTLEERLQEAITQTDTVSKELLKVRDYTTSSILMREAAEELTQAWCLIRAAGRKLGYRL